MKKILVLPGLLFLIFTASGQILEGIVIEKGTESQISFVISGNPTVFKNGKQSKWTFPVDDKKRRVKIYQSMSINARVER